MTTEENDAVNNIEAALEDAQRLGRNVEVASNFFWAGEWLLALIELEALANKDDDFRRESQQRLLNARKFYWDVEDPFA